MAASDMAVLKSMAAVTSGRSERPHCFAASSAMRCRRAVVLSALSAFGRLIQREDSKGTIFAAPSSTAFCTTVSSLSPLGYAMYRVMRTGGSVSPFFDERI